LPNGLTVILREDHSAPVVSAQAWCRTGSVDEGALLGAGLSHALEHMLFKGTKTRPGSRIDQEVQEAGGYMNAYTSFDRTVYYIDTPNTGASVAIDILCDIIQNATLPEEDLAKEKQVILREMDMNQDDPGRRSSRRLFETAFTRSPYRCTIIGYPDIFNEIKREDLAGYYHSRYAPNNVFLVVAGDFSSEAVMAQIEKQMGGAKQRPLPAPAYSDEPRQTAAREVIEEAPIEMAHTHFCWHVPGIRHPDLPALDVLASILGSGRSSRLFQRIREKQGLAQSVDAWVYCPGQIGLFGMSAVTEPGKFQAAAAALLVEIENLKNEPPPVAELERARNQFLAATLSSRKTMQGQAQDLGGSWMTVGDLNFSARYLAAVRAVSGEDIQRVTRTYLTPENRTHYSLLPKGTLPPAAESAASVATNPVKMTTLANGLRLIVKEDHRLPFVEFRLVFKGGVLAETIQTNGVVQLATRMLLKGTPSRTAERIANEVEDLGGSIGSFGGSNSFGLTLELFGSDWSKGLPLLADLLLNSNFPAAEFEREREVKLAGIQAQKDQLLSTANSQMRRGLFGPLGYGLDPIGSTESVARLQTSDLKDFLETWAVPSNAVLAVFGDVGAEEARKAVEEVFGGWAAGNAPEIPDAGPDPSRALRVAETRDKAQAVLVMGFPGVSVRSEDRFALDLLHEACSDLGSRLFIRIRDELGLAYYVGSQHSCGLARGYFSFYAGFAPENASLVESEFRAQAARLREEGLTEAELKRAKAKMIGQKKISRQDLGGLALSTSLDEVYGLGHDYSERETALIEAVTLENVKEAARRHLRDDQAVVSLISPGQTATAPK
jgi:zinc protease